MSATSQDESDLNAWVDNELAAREREQFANRLLNEPAFLVQVEAVQAQRMALKALGDAVLAEGVPVHLLNAAQGGAQPVRQRRDRWIRASAMAASLAVLSFALGWWARAPWLPESTAGGVRNVAFARDAVIAHAVYAPEIKHPVEVAADQQAHLVQWLSKRLGSPLRAPDMQAQGFGLVGGRLLPGGEGARAQLMYQNAKGERVTLYVARLDGAAPVEPAFRIESVQGVSAFYWAEGVQAYALSGQLDRASLLRLAEVIYAQLKS